MCKKRGKKGAILLTIFQIIIIAAIAIIMFVAIIDLKNNLALEKNFLVRDLAMLTSTLQAPPGNVDYTYDQDLAEYEFLMTFEKNYVKIWNPNGKVAGYYFAENKDITFVKSSPDAADGIYVENLQLQKGESLKIIKEENKIEVKNG